MVAYSECWTAFGHDVNPQPGRGYIAADKTGVPDLQMVGYRENRVIWIELKVGKNNLSDRQREWHARYRRAGGFVTTCWTSREVARVLQIKAKQYGWTDRRLDAIVAGLS